MINNKFKFTFLTASLLLIAAGCSSDDNVNNADTQEDSGVISNSEMTLTYGSKLLGKYVDIKNSRISFNRLSEAAKSQASIQALKAVNNYQQPNLTGATALTGSNTVNINQAGQTYYIAANDTFTGSINFNQPATIYVLGTWAGNGTNVPNQGVVEVAPSGSITAQNFMLNGSQAVLNNYGTVNYNSSTLNGKVNNYNQFTFTQAVNLNGGSEVNNNCSMLFNGYTQLNATTNNNGFADFKAGFHINGSGNLVLGSGSVTDITGGSIGIDGKIKNTSNGFARIDISNASLGNINANPAFEGKIDVNTTLTIPNNKVDSQVTLNANTAVAANGCIPQRGLAVCDDSVLQFTLTANITSPTVNNSILSATGVKVVNGNAYVSYHTNDEVYGDAPNGSVRIFNIQNQQAPSLTAQADFNNAEFNGVDVNGNTLYAVGGNKAGARLMTTPLTSGTFTTNNLSVFNTFKLPSVTGKNSFVHNNMLWLVSGAENGGFFKLNPADNYSVSNQFYSQGSRAKYVAQNGTYQAFFAVEGSGAYLRIADIDGTNPREYRYSNLAQTVQDGKNVIAMDTDYVYVALSDKGVAKFSLVNGQMMSHFVPNDYRVNGSKIFKENGYTNGVAVNDCYLYVANGADGVIVLNKNTFNVVGSFKLAESANYVYADNGLLFVATGRNGLNIIKIN